MHPPERLKFKERLTIQNVGKDVEQLNLSNIADESANLYDYFGNGLEVPIRYKHTSTS